MAGDPARAPIGSRRTTTPGEGRRRRSWLRRVLTTSALAVAAVIAVAAPAYASTWALQTSGTTNDLYATSCYTSSACWSVGASGTVVVTTNGGSTWSSQSSGTSSNLYGISCVSASKCWAVGQSGTIRATTNGGSTWSGET